jgi:hypothetical protein
LIPDPEGTAAIRGRIIFSKRMGVVNATQMTRLQRPDLQRAPRMTRVLEDADISCERDGSERTESITISTNRLLSTAVDPSA